MTFTYKYKTLVLFASLGFLLISCSKTVKYESTTKKVRSLDTSATRVILHEDYIFVEKEAEQLKHYLVRAMQNRMKNNHRFQLEFVPSGQAVPQNDSNHPLVFIIGDIWFNQAKISGNQLEKVTRNQSGFNFSQSWDEIEQRKWDKDQLQTIISLYFIEIGSETRLLRATMTASNDNRQKVWAGNRQISDNQMSQFYRDKELQPAHTEIKADNNITMVGRVFDELADKAVNTHFNSL
ncbi:hypothetical protein KJ966_08725 [bacterium]|nr:hypothetical protein [bacterium]